MARLTEQHVYCLGRSGRVSVSHVLRDKNIWGDRLATRTLVQRCSFKGVFETECGEVTALRVHFDGGFRCGFSSFGITVEVYKTSWWHMAFDEGTVLGKGGSHNFSEACGCLRSFIAICEFILSGSWSRNFLKVSSWLA